MWRGKKKLFINHTSATYDRVRRRRCSMAKKIPARADVRLPGRLVLTWSLSLARARSSAAAAAAFVHRRSPRIKMSITKDRKSNDRRTIDVDGRDWSWFINGPPSDCPSTATNPPPTPSPTGSTTSLFIAPIYRAYTTGTSSRRARDHLTIFTESRDVDRFFFFSSTVYVGNDQ